jgi:inhibitor of KinA
MTAFPRTLTAGDSGLVVEFGAEIDPAVNRSVYGFTAAFEEATIKGVTELVPTYRSVLIHFDPLVLPPQQLQAEVDSLLARPGEDAAGTARSAPLYRIPVAYGGGDGPDLERVAEHAGMDGEGVVKIHSGGVYQVYMLGFLPGFPYLGGMDQSIACPRLETPRVKVPAGSVGIAESQTGVYPADSPGGWNLIGRTPVPLFDASKDPPAAIEPGSFVQFVPTGPDEIATIRAEISAGRYTIPVAEHSP